MLDTLDDGSVDLVCTSPPFALTTPKEYGNEPEEEYVAWFRKFAEPVMAKLTDAGSFVIDLGGAWRPGSATRSLYQHRLLIELVDEVGFHLAEDFYWFNRAKLPGPRQWVTLDRSRVKDAVNLLFWLSKTEKPKASNLRVLRPYSKAMQRMIVTGKYNEGRRWSEHTVGGAWARDRGGAIPPNVIETDLPDHMLGAEPDNMLDHGNNSSSDPYLTYCRENEVPAHPARFPKQVPEFFVKFLTEPGDVVVDIFAGSNMTGMVAEQHGRRWISCDIDGDYVTASVTRFPNDIVKVTPAGQRLGVPRSASAAAFDTCSERCCSTGSEPPGTPPTRVS